MDIEILNQKKAVSLKREDIVARASFVEEKTPSRQQLKDAIAKKIKAKPELILVKHVASQFGAADATVTVYKYDDETALKRFEAPYMVKRNAAQPKKETKPAEPKSEEKKELVAEKSSEEELAKTTESKEESAAKPVEEKQVEAKPEEKPPEKKPEASPVKEAESKQTPETKEVAK